MRVFLAGIMQGSLRSAELHTQDYRRQIHGWVREFWPAAQLYDPLADHGQSLSYDDELGREVFFRHNQMCGQTDVLLAIVPEASMGTAIEMWEAYRHGRTVVTVSPLVHNWVVRFLSQVRYATLEELHSALRQGELQRLVAAHRRLNDERSLPGDVMQSPLDSQ